MSQLIEKLKQIKHYEKSVKKEHEARIAAWGNGTQEDHIIAELRDAGYEFEVTHPKTPDDNSPASDIVVEITFRKGKKGNRVLKHDIIKDYDYPIAIYSIARFIYENGIKPRKA